MAPSIPTITQTQPDLTDPGVHYDRLIAILENCVAEAKTQPLPLGRVFDQMQTASYDLICILLCLPFLQPISLGPLSTIGGLNFAALGWQLMRGQPTPWIPDRISRSTLSERLWLMLLKTCLFIFKTLRRFTRPRLQHWVAGPSGKRLCGSLIIIAGLLMAIPLAGIPLNNTLPVLVILFVSIAQLERDGLMLGVAIFWLGVTLLYFSFLGYTLFFLGGQALRWWPL